MRRGWWRAAVVGVVCFVAAGCGDASSVVPAACRDGGCRSQRSENALFHQTVTREVDVLFVVDDTAALAARADAVAASLRGVATLLAPDAPVAGGAASVHVAFVSASNAAAAAPGAQAAACGVGPEAFLATGRCGRAPNTARPFEDAFACLASLGNGSTGTVEPFAALRRALDVGGGQAIAGFLRPHAYLQIVVVAGQDDEGTTSVEDLVGFLKGLKERSSQILVSVVGPPLECGDAGATRLAPRLGGLWEAFGVNGVYANLCVDDPVRRSIAPLFSPLEGLSGTACLSKLRDTAPDVPGLQPDCVVTDYTYVDVDGGTGFSRTESPLPDCDHGGPPCWRLTSNACGPAGGHLVSFDRGAAWCPQDGFTTLVTCLTCPHADDPACSGN